MSNWWGYTVHSTVEVISPFWGRSLLIVAGRAKMLLTIVFLMEYFYSWHVKRCLWEQLLLSSKNHEIHNNIRSNCRDRITQHPPPSTWPNPPPLGGGRFSSYSNWTVNNQIGGGKMRIAMQKEILNKIFNTKNLFCLKGAFAKHFSLPFPPVWAHLLVLWCK